MSDSTTLTEAAIRRFVAAWYEALDFHVPIEQAYALLADEGLNMQFPDGDIRDYNSFKTWYDRVTNLFFDENHYVQQVEMQIDGDTAVLDVIVGWQASWWEAPAAKSKRVSMDATQRWTVRSSDKNAFGMVIEIYNATVEPFKYAPGFARL
ncbi:nuclear transport factor 2 family protein [Candidatus Chloroploca sp. M-50]|uniref:Nuclear transport factor 2 family protein n=1 Tax=Candidatus Chloroploca mongolica TaxID=2528176 RepID=A0ABS4DC14_9CHLR|nr:nuclear transport factor 2 family protein [Candidatus Chloroploca mongolica]MBP1466980.1 nuclear transport factor 2 family protein [Candidatus Chloroploca mongolica]